MINLYIYPLTYKYYGGRYSITLNNPKQYVTVNATVVCSIPTQRILVFLAFVTSKSAGLSFAPHHTMFRKVADA